MAQRDAAGMAELLEVCCLWHSTWATLQTYIGAGDALEKIDAMWKQGMLDQELKMHVKSQSADFDCKKLSFVLEAKGVVQDYEIERAQGRIQSAFKQSLVAGWNLFKTNLESDQVAHRRHLVAASGDTQRARAGVVNALQDSGSTSKCDQCMLFSQAEADADNSGALSAKMEPWLQATLAGFNGGIRRADNECIIGFVNFPVAGVVSSWKQHFALQQVTSLCHAFPRTFLAVLVLPNRAGDLRSSASKAEKAEESDEGREDNEQDEDVKEEKGADDDEPLDADSILRDFHHKLQCAYMERERNLKVRLGQVIFSPSSVYGTRSAFHQVLLVMANDRQNVFQKSSFWKTRVVSDVEMLPRASMVKLPKGDTRYGSEGRFTRVQELKQACGGTSFCGSIFEALLPHNDCPTCILDFLGYDSWPATYAMTQVSRGRRWAAGSIGHSNSETTHCANLIAQKVFGLARSAALKVAGFPRFEEAIQELQSLQTVQTPSYEVTVALPDGTLVVKDAVLDLWQRKHTDFAQECSALLEDHDKEFNPKHVRRGGSEVNDNSTCELPNKKLVTEGTLDKEEFEKNRADRLTLSCGAVQLHWCPQTSQLFITSEAQHTAEAGMELFSFGSGDFLSSTEASDVMSDTTSGGRWLVYDLFGEGDKLVLLESDAKLPQHLQSLDVFNKVL
ncbi:unnamed protein product [Effrenium voratum]|uniref:Uncharacterized protein n=1 Tax=Effrenium voratum TaxID=2562239 RepID=A0AA36HUE2_9DINO|nr:unnamed protein product [Effrenium voratum]